jgi:hypothetical protein
MPADRWRSSSGQRGTRPRMRRAWSKPTAINPSSSLNHLTSLRTVTVDSCCAASARHSARNGRGRVFRTGLRDARPRLSGSRSSRASPRSGIARAPPPRGFAPGRGRGAVGALRPGGAQHLDRRRMHACAAHADGCGRVWRGEALCSARPAAANDRACRRACARSAGPQPDLTSRPASDAPRLIT